MTRGRIHMRAGVVLVSLMMVVAGAGCASKQVASTSGDQSTTMKSKPQTGGPVESVKQEPMASVETGPSVEGTPSREAREQPPIPPTPGSSSTPSSSLAPSSSASPLPSAASPAPTAGWGDIYFDFDQYNIRSDAQAVLDANAKWLRTGPGKSVVIEGHCDERGTLAYNLVLGEKRAKSAKRYLEDLGIPGSRMQTTSYGEVRPVCKEHHEGCYSKNRRAHFVVH